MSTVADIAIGLAPLWVIDKRLAYHTAASGRLLWGLKYDREGKIEADGTKNLPYIQPLTYADAETYAAGSTYTLGPPIHLSYTMLFLVGAKREYGLFQRDPGETISDVRYQGKGVLDWVGRIRDAVERKADGTDTIDWKMEATISKPMLTTVREAPISDLVWSVILEYTISVENICRASRHVNI